jgi:hypothetical protein
VAQDDITIKHHQALYLESGSKMIQLDGIGAGLNMNRYFGLKNEKHGYGRSHKVFSQHLSTRFFPLAE